MNRDAVRWVLVTAALLLNYNSAAHQLDGTPELIRLPQEGVSAAFSQRDDSTTLYSADNYLKCTSDQHVSPTSTKEVSDLIKLHATGTKSVKIRATRRGFHSSTGLVCPGGRDSSKKVFNETVDMRKDENGPGSASITVLLHLMNRVVAVDAEKNRLTVEAGMSLLNLADAAEASRMSVRAGAFSIYGNLTVGGVISASAHGSGFRTLSGLGDLVTEVKWVNGKGDIIVSDSETEAGAKEVKALVGGLGLLGIITEFTLQLEPPSRTIVETRNGLDDANIVSDVINMLKFETPHVIVHWRPDFGTYRVNMWTQVLTEDSLSASAPAYRPSAKCVYLSALDDGIASDWSDMMAAWEGDMAEESATADVLNADVYNAGVAMNTCPFFQDIEDGTVLERATIPTNYAMLSPECAPKCIFDEPHSGNFAEDVEFTIKLSQLEQWVQDVKTIVRIELEEVQAWLDKRYGQGKVKRYMPPGYFWLRFGQATESLLSTSAGTEDVVFVQWTSLHSAMIPYKPSKQASIMETIEQLSLCKYKARPHWGKNHERVFRHPKCHVRDNLQPTNVARLLELQEHHDPQKLFEPELFTHVLQKSGPDYSALCTLYFWCYCQDDAHCPQGHACQPSSAFPEYKICKHTGPFGGLHDEF